MRGSEKQIKWANDIINGWKNEIQKRIDESILRVDEKTMPPIWADINKKIGDTIFKKIESFDDASLVIRDLNSNVGKMFSSMVSAEYGNPDNQAIKEVWMNDMGYNAK